MSFMDQLTQLIVVVVMLVVAYFGVMVWTRRANKEGGGGTGGGGGLFGMGGGAGVESGGAHDLDDVSAGPDIPKSADRKGRFNLTGRDAEVAAKVLKRMLQQDKDEREG